ncbi:MAG TPA: MBL fold metallo-hydrolase [Solirubrobacterales bacterium]|nr:MBL fold metallo-hydrolase [Solirubrobacterales bacterium]
MKYLAPGVWRLKEFPAPTINVYLAEDVLIDAGRSWDKRRIFAELEGREISLLALTHVHPDHQGCAKAVCEARGVPLACHADDVEAMEGKRPVQEASANNPVNRLIRSIWEGPPYKVERVLQEGDGVAGFRVVHAPGHARGEVIFFRESDRVAICGDVIRNMSYATGLPGIKEPPEIFTYDMAENRRSIRKLAALNPTMILPGHGPAVTDVGAFERFVSSLPG